MVPCSSLEGAGKSRKTHTSGNKKSQKTVIFRPAGKYRNNISRTRPDNPPPPKNDTPGFPSPACMINLSVRVRVQLLLVIFDCGFCAFYSSGLLPKQPIACFFKYFLLVVPAWSKWNTLNDCC